MDADELEFKRLVESLRIPPSTNDNGVFHTWNNQGILASMLEMIWNELRENKSE